MPLKHLFKHNTSKSQAAMSDAEHAPMDAHPEVLALTPTSNPYLDFYRDFCATRKQELFDVFDPETPAKTRGKLFAALDVRVAMVRRCACTRRCGCMNESSHIERCWCCRSMRGRSQTSARSASSNTTDQYVNDYAWSSCCCSDMRTD